MNTTSRRLFSRVLFDAPCELQQGDLIWESQALDLSLQGVLLQKPDGLNAQIGESFLIGIRLGDDTTIINMTGALRHEEDGRLGFECLSMDLDSATHLRRLVELNLGDEAELHRELALLGQS